MAPARDNEFLPELWALYSIGTLWFVLRFAVQLRTDGVKGFRLDDSFALIALIAWTYTCAIIHITYFTGSNSDFTAAEVELFDQKMLDQVEYGSKLFLGSWYAYLVLIFSLKGIVVILYQRIFFQPWQIWVLRITVALCVSGFIGLTLAFSLVCLPYSQRWQISPPPSIRCTASPKILITTSCVNAITDVFLLSVPVSLLWNLNKPLRTRIAVFVLLASGLFVLAACILRVSLTVVPNIFVLNIARWGVREFCIAIVAVNSASLRPLFRNSFWTTRPYAPPNSPNKPHHPAQQNPQQGYLFPSAHRARANLSRIRHRTRNLQMLNSTSAGASTVDVYIQREFGEGEEEVFEDPDFAVVREVEMQAVDGGERDRERDLEKGEAFQREIVRMDSGFPQVEDDGSLEGEGAGSSRRSSGVSGRSRGGSDVS